jgi:hypothetical protein
MRTLDYALWANQNILAGFADIGKIDIFVLLAVLPHLFLRSIFFV